MLQALAELFDTLLKFDEAMFAQDLNVAAVHVRSARRRVELLAREVQQTPLHAVVSERVDGCEQRLTEAAHRCWSACWSVQPTGKGEQLGCCIELSMRVGKTSVPQLLELLRDMGTLRSSLEQASTRLRSAHSVTSRLPRLRCHGVWLTRLGHALVVDPRSLT